MSGSLTIYNYIFVTFITNNFQRMKIIGNNIFFLINKLAAVEELSDEHKGNTNKLLASGVACVTGVFLFKTLYRVIWLKIMITWNICAINTFVIIHQLSDSRGLIGGCV